MRVRIVTINTQNLEGDPRRQDLLNQELRHLDLRLLEATDVPWATMAVVVEVPGEGELLFIAATGSWRLDAESARERQVIAISDLDSRQRRPLPTIIAGDLNAEPDSASMRYLTGLQSLAGRSVHYHDAWSVAGVGPGYTWTADNSNAAAVIDAVVRQPHHRRRIDYVLIGAAHAHPEAHCHIRGVNLTFNQPQDGIWASDHHGLAVDVEIGRNT